ncbi:MAG: O-antigen ligase family protein [Candidatus Parcubacteria bacterium]|nr:O-antigen ligase family protein [Candidatus Parcubacteria bacterium]
MIKLDKIIEYLFYLFVFLLPLQTCWIWKKGLLGAEPSQYLAFCFYGTEIILVVILFLGLIHRLFSHDWETSFLHFKSMDFYILILLFIIIGAISLFFSADKQISLLYLLRLLEGFGLLVLIINFKFSYLNIAGAFVLGALVQSVLAIYQFMTQQVLASKWLGMAAQNSSTAGTAVIESDSMRWLRAYGTFPHPNILGGYLAIAFLLLIVLLIIARHKWEKVLLWACLPIILCAQFFTFSKNGFLALAIGLIFLGIFIYLSKDKKAKKTFAGIIFAMFLTLGILALIYKDPILTRINGENRLEVKSLAERTEYWTQAKEIWQDSWLTGIGLGNYTQAMYDQSKEKLPAYNYQPVHNVYMLVATELGIVGFIFFALLIILALRKIYKYQIDDNIVLLGVQKLFKFRGIFDFYRQKLFWFLAYTSIFFALLVLMMFDHYLWTQYSGVILWWFCFGMFIKTMGWVR